MSTLSSREMIIYLQIYCENLFSMFDLLLWTQSSDKMLFTIIYLILLQLLLIFIMELWDYFFYLQLPMIVYLPLSGILSFCKNNSFHWLLKLIQGILKNIRQNWEYLKMFKKELFYNFVSFWWICNKILRRWN